MDYQNNNIMEMTIAHQKLEAEYMALSAKYYAVIAENEDLKKEQKEFQDVLILKVEEIQNSPKAWRWLKYGKLLTDLIDTILGAIAKVKAKNENK